MKKESVEREGRTAASLKKRRIRLIVAYDGTNYCGWQLQENGITIEEVLNRELSRLFNEDIQVIGASRTDSGVHAWGNIAVFDTFARMPAEKIAIALNQRLPEDLVVQSSEEVGADYHPRKRNTIKTYEYRILNRRIPFPAERLNTYFYYYDLDIDRMRQAAACLIGEHDFVSFCSARHQAEDTVRRIESLDIQTSGDRIDIRIRGNGFLYNMVRIIVGTLIKIGSGFWAPERMKEILEARDRSKAGPKAPPQGLTLISIEETEAPEILLEENEHWSYRLVRHGRLFRPEAFLTIRHCEERDFERTVLRLTKYAVRNGAERVYVCDRDHRFSDGWRADYFQYREAGELWQLSWRSEDASQPAESAASQLAAEAKSMGVWLQPLQRELAETYFQVYRDSFSEVFLAQEYRMEDVLQLAESKQTRAYLIRFGAEAVGFTEWVEQEPSDRQSCSDRCLELDGVGILPAWRGRGIGEAVIRDFQAAVARERFSAGILTAAVFHPQLERFYQRMGFVRERCWSHWYVTWDEKNS